MLLFFLCIMVCCVSFLTYHNFNGGLLFIAQLTHPVMKMYGVVDKLVNNYIMT